MKMKNHHSTEQLHPMKKKSSKFFLIYWGTSLVVAIGLGLVFILVEIYQMNSNRFHFFNIKMANIELTPNELNTSNLSDNSPVFAFVDDMVLFGSVRGMTSPDENQEVLLMNIRHLNEEFRKKIISYKNAGMVFPAQSYGVMFKNQMDYEKHIQFLSECKKLIEQENKKSIMGKNAAPPALVLLGFINPK